MNLSKIKIIIITGTLLLFFTGCINVNKNFKEIRNNVLSNFDESFKKSNEFAIGPAAMHLASSFVNIEENETDMDVGLMLRQVNKIQIGIYERKKSYNFESYKKDKLKDHLSDENWTRIIINKEPNSISEIFVKEDNDEKLRQMLVVNVESEQIIIIELSGDLDELIAVALANNGFKIAASE